MTDRHEKLAAVPHSAPFEKRQKTSHHLFLALWSAPKNLSIKQTEHIRTYQKKKKKGNQKNRLNLLIYTYTQIVSLPWSFFAVPCVSFFILFFWLPLWFRSAYMCVCVFFYSQGKLLFFVLNLVLSVYFYFTFSAFLRTFFFFPLIQSLVLLILHVFFSFHFFFFFFPWLFCLFVCDSIIPFVARFSFSF